LVVYESFPCRPDARTIAWRSPLFIMLVSLCGVASPFPERGSLCCNTWFHQYHPPPPGLFPLRSASFPSEGLFCSTSSLFTGHVDPWRVRISPGRDPHHFRRFGPTLVGGLLHDSDLVRQSNRSTACFNNSRSSSKRGVRFPPLAMFIIPVLWDSDRMLRPCGPDRCTFAATVNSAISCCQFSSGCIDYARLLQPAFIRMIGLDTKGLCRSCPPILRCGFGRFLPTRSVPHVFLQLAENFFLRKSVLSFAVSVFR